MKKLTSIIFKYIKNICIIERYFCEFNNAKIGVFHNQMIIASLEDSISV